MILDSKPIDLISEEDIRVLINLKVPEGKRLDYKRELPKKEPSQNKEFLKDISSFANASGGYLIFGVDEENGYPSKISPLQIENPDAAILRLDQLILSGIEPRINGIVPKAIELEAGGYVIIIKIPQSWNSPHMVTSGGDMRFYSRFSREKYVLDVSGLRDAFLATMTLYERVKEFRRSRVDGLNSGEGPASLASGTRVVLHIIPLSSFGIGTYIDIEKAVQNKEFLLPIGTPNCGHTYNFEGYLAFNLFPEVGTDVHLSYAQVYRNGCIESACSLWFWGEENPLLLPALSIEDWILEGISMYLKFYKGLSIEPPFVASASILGIRGFELTEKRVGAEFPRDHIRKEHTYQMFTKIPKEDLLLPEVIIDKFDDDIGSLMKAPFDALWNSAGWSKSPGYEDSGERMT